jgi:lipoprotein-releasing system permease protein
MIKFHLSLKIAQSLIFSKSHFLKKENLISFLGIFIGVFGILTVSSVMNGFNEDMSSRIFNTKGDIKIYKRHHKPIQNVNKINNILAKNHNIKAASGIIKTELIAQKKSLVSPVIVYGVKLAEHKKITKLLENITLGHPNKKSFNDDGIIIGLDLSFQLNATVGQSITLFSGIGTIPSPFGLIPKSKKFTIIGIFQSGIPTYDAAYVYVSRKNSRFFTNIKNGVESIEVKTSNPDKSLEVANQIQSKLGKNYIVEDWSSFESNLYSSMKFEKYVTLSILFLMIIIASFNMSGNFIRIVAEKKSELGILKSIGLSEAEIIKTFLFVSLIIGLLGVLCGSFLSLTVLFIQSHFHLIRIPVPGFPIQFLPVKIIPIDFLVIFLITFVITMISSIYPILQALKIDIISVIRDNIK